MRLRIQSPTSRWTFALLLVAMSIAFVDCAPPLPPTAFEGNAPEMQPQIFFSGTTYSSGVLENRFGAPTSRFHVEGSGVTLPDGSFRLKQSITFDHDAPKMRTWVMRRLNAHTYTATLTGASGPVEGETYGNLFHLRYPMKTPFGAEMEQWMYLQPDGRTLINEATVSEFGFVVTHLSERITREHP